MKLCSAVVVGFLALSSDGSAEDLGPFQTLFDYRSVETRTLSIVLASVDEDIRFSITLQNKETGIRRHHEFDAPVPETPGPFQMEESSYCGILVVLLTVQYPWRHDWPERVRTMETYAFRESDFSFIDVADGSLTDIALAEQSAYEPSDFDMLPPVGVRCLPEPFEKPFQFFQRVTK